MRIRSVIETIIYRKYSDKIIDLVRNSDKITNSDMQGIAMAIVQGVMDETREYTLRMK